MNNPRKALEMSALNMNPIRPQNPSRPAGGASAANDNNPPSNGRSHRGVIVAPPSRNTSVPPMTLLHRGFDYLALAIKAHIPEDLFNYLEAEKERADDERRTVVIDYNGVTLHLKPHGGSGYRFLLQGGSDGAQWAFKKPNPKDLWGIRLTFGSDFMAMHGLGAAKAHVEHVTSRLGIRYSPDDVSISRVDFCADVLAPDFELKPDQFVMHSNAGRRDFVTGMDQSVHGRSGRVTSVTVGNICNRQVIIYDKREQVITTGKTQWWAIWNHTLRKIDGGAVPYVTLHREGSLPMYMLPNELDPSDASQSRVWRVEMRAGKTLLKDRWGIRTWAQLFERFGDLCRETGELVRYTDPAPGDTNRARWPNHLLWDIAAAEINDDLHEMRSGADPNPMKEVHREQHISTIFRNILGCSITLAALRDKQVPDLPDVITDLAQQMQDEVKANPAKTERQLREAQERYVFIQKPEPPT